VEGLILSIAMEKKNPDCDSRTEREGGVRNQGEGNLVRKSGLLFLEG